MDSVELACDVMVSLASIVVAFFIMLYLSPTLPLSSDKEEAKSHDQHHVLRVPDRASGSCVGNNPVYLSSFKLQGADNRRYSTGESSIRVLTVAFTYDVFSGNSPIRRQRKGCI